MSRGPDAATLLVRALDFSARRAGLTLVVRHADWRRWASATFANRLLVSVSQPIPKPRRPITLLMPSCCTCIFLPPA